MPKLQLNFRDPASGDGWGERGGIREKGG
jgi:hypothetical protein